MTKTKLAWRMKTLPTIEELRELVKDKIITNDEARSILFSEKEETERNTESLKEEIKFLRKLVDSLAERQTVVTTIREIIPNYPQPWSRPYVTWCADPTTTVNFHGSGGGGSGYMGTSGIGIQYTGTGKLSDIRTF